MGTAVLDSGVPTREGLHLYAQCLPAKPGGVTLLVINNSRTTSESIDLPMAAERYTLTAEHLQDEQVQLNGDTLKLQANGDLPVLGGQQIPAGSVEFPSASITFLAIPGAGNASCR